MSDKDKLKTLLNSFNVFFTEKNNVISCEQGNNNVDGHIGFRTDFEFNEVGKFESMGAWE